MEESMSFVPLLIVVFLAFAVPIVLSRFRKLRLPIVVGEIIAGILIGRSGFGWVQHHEPILDLLSELGFVFLMFLSGMEIDFSSLGFSAPGGRKKGQPWNPFHMAGLSFGLTLLLSAGVGFGLVRLDLVSSPWMITLILSTTSLGVVVPVLKEKGLSRGRFGQTILISALIADFVTMLLITVVVAALSHGITLEILLIGLLFLVFFMMYYFGVLIFKKDTGVRRMLEELSHATAQIKVRASFAMMLIFVVLAEMLGTEVILGAFLAGAVVSLLSTPEDTDLFHQLDAIGYGFFIPIFFIMVGVDFNLASLLGSKSALLLVPLLLGAAVLVKILPSLVFRLNYSWRKTFGAGSLLSARLSLIIAASAIGLRLGVISEPVNAAIILVAIITVTLAPMLFSRIIPDREGGKEPPIVVVGAGSLGIQVAEHILSHNEPVILIDHHETRVGHAERRGLPVIHANVNQYDPNSEYYLNQARRLICVYSDVDRCYEVCERAHTTYGIDHIVARVTAPGELPRFEKLGVTPMNAATDQAMLLSLVTRNPSIYELLTRTDDDKEVCEIQITEARYTGRPLREIKFAKNLVILAVRRDGELIVPRGDTQLEYGDHLTVLGSKDCIEDSKLLFLN